MHYRVVMTLTVALFAQQTLWSQSEDWKAGVVKIKVPGQQPGTGFVVALERDQALIVTAAHVVKGADKPMIVFQANSGSEFPAEVLDQQSGDTRGFALLKVLRPPPRLRVIPPLPGFRKPQEGTETRVPGYPASLSGAFSVLRSSVTTTSESVDLIISPATGVGYSGGPVLIDGQVVGMIYGEEQNNGRAVPAAMVRTYLQLYRDSPIEWAPPLQSAPPARAGSLPSAPQTASPPATGGTEAKITLVNKTGFAIHKLYITQDTWTESFLGEGETFNAGETLDIELSTPARLAPWNLRLTNRNGKEFEFTFERLSLLEWPTVTLSVKGGRVSADGSPQTSRPPGAPPPTTGMIKGRILDMLGNEIGGPIRLKLISAETGKIYEVPVRSRFQVDVPAGKYTLQIVPTNKYRPCEVSDVTAGAKEEFGLPPMARDCGFWQGLGEEEPEIRLFPSMLLP